MVDTLARALKAIVCRPTRPHIASATHQYDDEVQASEPDEQGRLASLPRQRGVSIAKEAAPALVFAVWVVVSGGVFWRGWAAIDCDGYDGCR